MIPVSQYAGQSVAVIGLGRSGFATAQALKLGGATPIVWDDSEKSREAARELGYEIRAFATPEEFKGIRCCVVSPGIPHLYPEPHPAILAARRAYVPLDNEIGLFFQEINTIVKPVIAVTGSNGKSTTTALIGHILRENGYRVGVGGNIGAAALSLPPSEECDVYVLELSSYQTELASKLDAQIAVFLNLSDDHLERHGGRGAYFAAKRRLMVQAQQATVIGGDTFESAVLMRECSNPVRICADSETAQEEYNMPSVAYGNGQIQCFPDYDDEYCYDLTPAKALPGLHNHQNAAAAFMACLMFGVYNDDVMPAIYSFEGLAHRSEFIIERDGVRWINDSKATNADAAEKALLAYENIHWIIGGVAKAGGIQPLLPLLSRVKKAYLIGEASAEFAKTLVGHPHQCCETLENAVAQIAQEAKQGDVALLSPACASFDQFQSFEARGEAFRALVKALPV